MKFTAYLNKIGMKKNLEKIRMSEHKPEWPETGDLVIVTIESVMDYGAYANLDEYSRRGFLHISEISSARIRNVRDFVREHQKMVLKFSE